MQIRDVRKDCSELSPCAQVHDDIKTLRDGSQRAPSEEQEEEEEQLVEEEEEEERGGKKQQTRT